MLDLAAPTPALCRARCCADAMCVHWQFDVGSLAGCHRGLPANCTMLADGNASNGRKLFDVAASPPSPSLPPPWYVDETSVVAPAPLRNETGGSTGTGALISVRGMTLEYIIIASSIGIFLLICVGGCFCWFSYERYVRASLPVHPRVAARMAIDYIHDLPPPKVHRQPQLTNELRAELRRGRADPSSAASEAGSKLITKPSSPGDVVLSCHNGSPMQAAQWGTFAPSSPKVLPEQREVGAKSASSGSGRPNLVELGDGSRRSLTGQQLDDDDIARAKFADVDFGDAPPLSHRDAPSFPGAPKAPLHSEQEPAAITPPRKAAKNVLVRARE